MIKMPSNRKTALTLAASAAALFAFSGAAHAAKCFSKDTDDPKAGDATAVVGPEVGVLHSSGDDFARPDAGDDLFTGDRVRTGAASHLQVKLCDWSTYTFSPESESDISEFFDSEGAGRRRVINFIRGGFRYGSGRDTEPGSTQVEIQDSGVTMGVRGTNVLLVELDGIVYALLEGPALDNTGLSPQGLVDFWEGNEEDIIARLKRPGYVVTIGPDGVSRPFRADPELLRRIYEAFVPVIPDEDGDETDYEGDDDPGDGSGQTTQEGGDAQDFAEYQGEQRDDTTEQYPEEPYRGGVNIGEVLPLDALEEFAANQGLMPDGHVLALAPARLFVDSGVGEVLQDEGVALIQIHIDWATRTLAPEALASFVKLDFSVSDPTDLTVRDFDYITPDEIDDAYLQAVLASSNIPFSAGQNGLAVIPSQLFTFIVRQGPGDTVTVDVETDISLTDSQMNIYRGESSALNLMLLPGEGDLAMFQFDIGEVFTPNEYETLFGASGGTLVLSGSSDSVVNTLTGTIVNGVSAGRLVVDFDNRLVGGNGSFLAISSGSSFAFAFLNQAISLDNGLFGLAFYPLSTLSSDSDVLKGQALLANTDGAGADVAGILLADSGAHLWTEVIELTSFGNYASPLATIAGLDANTAGDFAGMGLSSGGVGTLHYDATISGRGFLGFTEFTSSSGIYTTGLVEASIDINFGSRTIGGGFSYVAVSISDSFNSIFVNFIEGMNAVSFDDSAEGSGAFSFSGADFTGSSIDSALLLIRDDPRTSGQGEYADMFFSYTNSGGKGFGQTDIMPLMDNATPGGG